MIEMKCNLLHSEMIAIIDRYWSTELPEQHKVESTFSLAEGYWKTVRNELKDYLFVNTDEEIHFYKNVKPKFTSYIEYSIILYQALSFAPADSNEFLATFWEGEEKRLDRFVEKHSEFVKYYNSGCTYRDLQYFLPANDNLVRLKVSKPYDLGSEYKTSHDHLVAGFLAQLMYHEYVLKKLKTL